MNGGRKRRFPVTVAACSVLVLAISVVTAQQVFDGNRQPAFVRRQPAFQQQQPNQVIFQQNRNFVLPSASPLRPRNLFTRQISHRHRPRQRSSFRTASTTQPALTTRKRQRSRTTTMSFRSKPPSSSVRFGTSNANSNQHRTTKIMSNISRRQPIFQPRRQPFMVQQRPQQFRFQPQPPRVQRVQNIPRFPMAPPQRATRFRVPPLAPMPFGSVQRTRRPVRPFPTTPTTPAPTTTTPTPSTTAPTTTTTEPLPSTTHVIHSVGGSLRRPIRVQQLQLNLRRKPQMTRGQFRRPKFPITRHQPTHRITKPDRVTRPIVRTTTSEPVTETTTEEVALTVAGTTPEAPPQRSSDLKKVDDIEAAILQAVIESSSPEPPPTTAATTVTHRQRIHRIRPGHRHRPSPPAPPPRVDAIEEAVLRAVLEATPAASEETTTTEKVEETTTTTEEPTTTTTQIAETTSLFPAFARGRHGHRRPPTTVTPTTVEVTTVPTTVSSEEPVTTTTTEATTTTTEATTTTTSEEPTTITVEGTTSETVTDVTIALPEDGFEDINAKEDHQLHQIEENVISALSTPTSTIAPSPIPPAPLPSSSPSPPSPPAPPPHEFSNQAGPPGSMPPSDDIVDELNGSSDFLQVAQKLHLLRRLLQ